MDAISDPDRFALAAVQQYLHEHGYERALAALEQEAGLRVKDEAPRGSQLLQLVYDHIERQLADSAPDDASATLRRLEDSLLRGGSTSSAEDCPTQPQRSIEGLHAANIIAIRCWPERRLALTGSSDGTVTLLGYDGALHRSIAASSSGVLCLALRPGSNGGGGSSSSSASASRGGASGSADAPSIAAAGCMDGSVVLLDVDSGAVLATARPHRKYCVSCAWSPDGRHLVTGAWDETFAVHHLQRSSGGGSGSGGDGSTGGSGWELRQIYLEQTTGRVNAVEFLPAAESESSGNGNGGAGLTGSGSAAELACASSSNSSAGDTGDASSSSGNCGNANATFLVAVQGSNYLCQLSIAAETTTGAAGTAGTAEAAAVREERRINMNALGDDHVSFSAAHLAASACGRLLLVSGDNGRLVVYETAGWAQVRSIIGLPVEQFHHFCAAWHRSGHYVFAAAAHGGVCIFHLGSCKKVASLAAHSKNVRSLAYDATNNLLLTCSFDRTVKVFESGE